MNRERKTLDIFCYTILFLVLTTKLCSAEEDFEAAQKRAGGNVGLFPFPRVGRSDPELSDWDSYNSFENYDDMPRHEVKRQGLVAFPRVGRSGSQNQRFYQQYSDFIKRSGIQGAGPSTHLWFGPRMGKRSLHDQGDN
ncbi:hypothetical protein PVAND_012900 [Polypedilum vanderplanki]|uniref:Uncharacterized protein n=1 Tax=Polypedilum vanderplanki TaxID=319348 RepID=A0A9J6CPT6_POLVA|nr:hypothetical protein PVAND_012900 [Polypedilum vanderplanki]